MGYKETYERWLHSDVLSGADRAELESIAGDEKEIEERFYRELEFGTAGMRGIIGIGTNRINIYNVRRASQGVAKYVNSRGAEAAKAGVLIGYDTRNYSRVFAEETAKVLTCAGVHVYLFPVVHSVPEVSFGIRELGCAAGVMITASHNPKEYNGYKVYGPDGGQLPPDAADVVVKAIDSYDVFDDVKYISLEEAVENSLLTVPGPELDEKFLDAVQSQQQNPEAVAAVADTFKLIYTPFHGTGSRPVKAILNRIGFKNVLVVKEQDTDIALDHHSRNIIVVFFFKKNVVDKFLKLVDLAVRDRYYLGREILVFVLCAQRFQYGYDKVIRDHSHNAGVTDIFYRSDPVYHPARDQRQVALSQRIYLVVEK